ncbi:MAG: hypothetical protein NT069_29740, partial [Planctomycetota bacterium]|nr:hypothetical protein [Planctomycetota bacterium]
MWYTLTAAGAMAGALTILAGMLLRGNRSRAAQRLLDLSGKSSIPAEQEYVDNLTKVVRATLPKMGQQLMPGDE